MFLNEKTGCLKENIQPTSYAFKWSHNKNLTNRLGPKLTSQQNRFFLTNRTFKISRFTGRKGLR